MSLTSYRAAPPRVEVMFWFGRRSRPGVDYPGHLGVCFEEDFVLGRPGGDLLSQVLRHSTIGADAFDGRVRDGIGSGHVARATRPAKNED